MNEYFIDVIDTAVTDYLRNENDPAEGLRCFLELEGYSIHSRSFQEWLEACIFAVEDEWS